MATGLPAFHSFQHGGSYVHLNINNRSWLQGLTSEEVDLLYHGDFWGSALPKWWEDWAWDLHSVV